MKSIEKMRLSVGIIGGIGLGLVLGSEFSGRHITTLGAIFVIISLVSISLLKLNELQKQRLSTREIANKMV